jgi:hypothetical protein
MRTVLSGRKFNQWIPRSRGKRYELLTKFSAKSENRPLRAHGQTRMAGAALWACSGGPISGDALRMRGFGRIIALARIGGRSKRAIG